MELKKIQIWNSLRSDRFAQITAHVVCFALSLILGLEVMRQLEMVIRFAARTLQSHVKNGRYHWF